GDRQAHGDGGAARGVQDHRRGAAHPGGAGAIAVVLSGFILARPYMESGQVPGWLGTMMGAGLLGAIGAVAISVPTAAKPAALEPGPGGQLPEAFLRLRKRQILAASIAGALGLIAMGAVTIGRW